MNDSYNPNENPQQGTPDGQNQQEYHAQGVWNVPPRDGGEPYYSESFQQKDGQGQPTGTHQPSQYSTGSGWQQRGPQQRGTPYQWNFADYEHAAVRKRQGKGIRVFVILLCSVLAIAVVSFAGIGVMSMVNQGSAPQSGEIAEVPTVETPVSDPLTGMTLQDKPEDDTPLPEDGPYTTEQVVEKVSPSVVAITTYINYQSYRAEGMGSGIILRDDGYIVTNAHVVEDARGITVQLNDGQSYEGRVVGSDSKTDLAVVKIDATGLPAAVFGNSDQVKVGERVIAIGNPQSMDFAGSVTQGIVSGLNRQITASNENGTSTHYTNLIQTDAAINPGNSGGALVNAYGQVIGINSAKVIASGAEGMGFAIPSNSAEPVVSDLINYGRVTGRVRLGIYATEVDEVLARLNHVPTGLFVQSTEPGSDISTKGVVPGDIITKVEGQEITSTQDLTEVIEGKKPGDTVELEVYRPSQRPNGQGTFFNVTIELMEDTTGAVSEQDETQEQLPEQDLYGDGYGGYDGYDEFEDFFSKFFG